jgi:hypothetical protein
LDEIYKSTTQLSESLKESAATGKDITPFSRAFSTDQTVFEWYQTPEQAVRGARFNLGMLGLSKFNPATIVEGKSDSSPMNCLGVIERNVIQDLSGKIYPRAL